MPDEKQHHRQGEKNPGADPNLQRHGHRVGDLQRQQRAGVRSRQMALSLFERPPYHLHHLADSQNADHRTRRDRRRTFQDGPTKILNVVEKRLFVIVHGNFLQPLSVTTPGREMSCGSWGISGNS